jgi:arginase family enzyme
MKARTVVFPFDLFGSPGAGAGAKLLADALREMVEDNRRERKPTRARAYQRRLLVDELEFETVPDYQDWRERGRAAVRAVLDKGDWLLWLAGNHLGVLPVFEELAQAGDGTLIVQLDAHLDIYHLTDCTSELSHGNFLLHCAGSLPPIVGVGHRELLLTPDHVGRYYRRTFSAAELAVDPEEALAYLRKASAAAARVFIDLDCDVFEPAFFPALSHPLPFGLGPPLVLRLLDAAWSNHILGVALSEFDPARDENDRSLATLVWLLEYLLLKQFEHDGPRKGRRH